MTDEGERKSPAPGARSFEDSTDREAERGDVAEPDAPTAASNCSPRTSARRRAAAPPAAASRRPGRIPARLQSQGRQDGAGEN